MPKRATLSDHASSWAVGCACLLTGWWLAETAQVHGDLLNLEMFYREVLVLGHPLSSFQFSEATFFFPDVLVYAAIRVVLPSPVWSLLVYAVLILAVAAVMLRRIHRRIWGTEDTRWSFALGFITLAFLLCTEPRYPFVALAPGIHGSILLLFLLWLWQLTALWQGDTRTTRWAGAGFVTALGFTLSDLLAVPSVIVPGLAALGWFAWHRRALRRPAARIATTNLAGLLLGLALKWGLTSGGILRERSLHVLAASWRRRIWTATQVADGLVETLGLDALAIAIILLIVVAVMVRRRTRRSSPTADRWLRGFVAFALLVLGTKVGAIAFTGRWQNLWSMRYLQELEYLPLVGIALWAVPSLTLGERGARAGSVALLAVGVGGLVAMPHRLPLLLPEPLVRCVDAHATELPTPWGYSDFWLGRQITFTSRRKIVVNPLTPDGRPYVWESSPHAFTEDVFGRKIERVTFFVPPDSSARAAAVARWGEPSSSVGCEGPTGPLELMIYPRGIDAAERPTR